MVKNEIMEVLGDDIIFFNGSMNLAIHLKEVLTEKKLLENNSGKIEFYDSKNSYKKEERFYNYLK